LLFLLDVDVIMPDKGLGLLGSACLPQYFITKQVLHDNGPSNGAEFAALLVLLASMA